MKDLYTPILEYNIKYIQNVIQEKHMLISKVHYMGQNGVTFCGKSDLLLTSSIVLREVTCHKCLAVIIADKYKTFVKHSDVPIYLYENVINAMLDFAEAIEENKQNMLIDPTPANIATDECIHIYLKDHLTNPHKILGDAYFQEREGYSTWWRQFDGRTICVFAAPTYNILYFEHKIEAKK